MASLFTDVKIAPSIEVFEKLKKYNEDDEHSQKVNLGVGAYRDENGKPWVLPVVHTVEAQMAADETLNHEYLSVSGLGAFSSLAYTLLLGESSPSITGNRVEGVQCLGGTGAIRLAAEFVTQHLGCNVVYVSKPTWGNHKGIFQAVGYAPENIREYRYWNEAGRSLDFKGMMEDFTNAPEHAVVILHGCAHNPTGVDPTKEQWEQIIEVIKARKLIVLLDQAYQGFATGDLDKDAMAARLLDRSGLEFFIAQSFSKNFGLYNERVGNMVVIFNNKDDKMKVKSQLELIVRKMWSNPPNHGARIVCTVLNNPAYNTQWKEDVKKMSDRIVTMRKSLFEKLVALQTPGQWDHITTQKGMFSYTGLTLPQVRKLQDKYGIYMLDSGRINMCGLTNTNIDYVAASINSVVKEAVQHELEQQEMSAKM